MTLPDHPSPNPLWLLDQPLLLASASVTRRDMLLRSGLAVDIEPARINERAVETDALSQQHDVSTVAATLARAKALEVSARFPDRLVIGADQTLVCDGQAFHKPADRSAAQRQLLGLAGKEHLLTSAFCLASKGSVLNEGTSSALMQMRPLSAAFVDHYLAAAGHAAFGSVGCYQVEGLGSQLFAKIDGDHFTILGLPLLQVLGALRQLHALAE